jgi:hypothetical protein
MNIRFVIFLAIAALIITGLVWFDLNREDPWNSDVFFGENSINPINVPIESSTSATIIKPTKFG